MKATEKPSVAIFIPTLNGGGAERAMLQFAEGLLSLGERVQLVVAKAKGPLKTLIPAEIELVDFNCDRTATALLPLSRFLRKHRPKALFSTIPHANLISALAKIISRVDTQVILRESNSPVTEKKASFGRKFVHFLVPYLYPRADGVIAVSEGVKVQLASLEKKPGDFNIRVLATPVVSRRMLESANEPLNDEWITSSDSKIILGCGRLVQAKGFDILLKAFALVSAQIEARLVILGTGPLESNLKSLAAELEISDHVYFAGFKSNPFPYFRSAEVFALSSRFEGMPNVLIQAMALGTKVVSTDCKSGPRECLKQGVWGALVPVDDISAMADALIDTLNDAGTKADALDVQHQYSSTRAAKKYLDFALCTRN